MRPSAGGFAHQMRAHLDLSRVQRARGPMRGRRERVRHRRRSRCVTHAVKGVCGRPFAHGAHPASGAQIRLRRHHGPRVGVDASWSEGARHETWVGDDGVSRDELPGGERSQFEFGPGLVAAGPGGVIGISGSRTEGNSMLWELALTGVAEESIIPLTGLRQCTASLQPTSRYQSRTLRAYWGPESVRGRQLQGFSCDLDGLDSRDDRVDQGHEPADVLARPRTRGLRADSHRVGGLHSRADVGERGAWQLRPAHVRGQSRRDRVVLVSTSFVPSTPPVQGSDRDQRSPGAGHTSGTRESPATSLSGAARRRSSTQDPGACRTRSRVG